MKNRLEEIFSEIESFEKQLSNLIPQIADARRRAFSKNSSKSDKKELRMLELKGKEINDRMSSLIEEAQKLIGIPEEVFEEIEKIEIGGDSIESTKRELLTHDQIKPNEFFEDSLSDSLDLLRGLVSNQWIECERTKQYRLNAQFLNAPLSIVRGVRIESEFLCIHRFAQGLLVAEDFINDNPNYDFWAGSLLIPQICGLGLKFLALKEVKGDVNERISSLWRDNSELTDSTVFELLVAASCTLFGRKMEFLSTSNIKSPDLRVHDYRIPLVVECKRKKALSNYELNEEKLMRNLFFDIHRACKKLGISGIFNLKLKVEANDMTAKDIANIAVSLRLSPYPGKELEYDWGKISFQPLPDTFYVPDTKLYSPNFLKSVFNWDNDLPEHDGIICKVKSPDENFVNVAHNPVGLTWSNFSTESLKRKTWTVASSFGKATKQVPPGEVGIIYLCFHEGTRSANADKKIDLLNCQLEQWAHDASIRLPVSFAIRLIPRPLFHGAPDLIETGFRFCSKLYGDPIYYVDFPTCVFHNQQPITIEKIISDK